MVIILEKRAWLGEQKVYYHFPSAPFLCLPKRIQICRSEIDKNTSSTISWPTWWLRSHSTYHCCIVFQVFLLCGESVIVIWKKVDSTFCWNYMCISLFICFVKYCICIDFVYINFAQISFSWKLRAFNYTDNKATYVRIRFWKKKEWRNVMEMYQLIKIFL